MTIVLTYVLCFFPYVPTLSLVSNLSLSLCALVQGHSSYITHLDWSPDNHYIMSNSGDYEILYCKSLLTLLLSPFYSPPHPFTLSSSSFYSFSSSFYSPPPFYAAPSPFYSALLTLLPCPLTLLLTHSLFLNQTHICSNKSTQWVTLWFMLC